MAPTIFLGLPQDGSLVKEDILGPVVCINTCKTEAEAIALANDTEYGLYASVFTNDPSRAIRCTKALEAGIVGVNSSSPERMVGLGFSGWKSSRNGKDAGPNDDPEITVAIYL